MTQIIHRFNNSLIKKNQGYVIASFFSLLLISIRPFLLPLLLDYNLYGQIRIFDVFISYIQFIHLGTLFGFDQTAPERTDFSESSDYANQVVTVIFISTFTFLILTILLNILNIVDDLFIISLLAFCGFFSSFNALQFSKARILDKTNILIYKIIINSIIAGPITIVGIFLWPYLEVYAALIASSFIFPIFIHSKGQFRKIEFIIKKKILLSIVKHGFWVFILNFLHYWFISLFVLIPASIYEGIILAGFGFAFSFVTLVLTYQSARLIPIYPKFVYYSVHNPSLGVQLIQKNYSFHLIISLAITVAAILIGSIASHLVGYFQTFFIVVIGAFSGFFISNSFPQTLYLSANKFYLQTLIIRLFPGVIFVIFSYILSPEYEILVVFFLITSILTYALSIFFFFIYTRELTNMSTVEQN